ncbi:hypothetical protein QUF75_17235 [Desulfococcaceae bacterium HSG7]|nr:hypothetical protein [Desulfococcaceae bacterium HSG7]
MKSAMFMTAYIVCVLAVFCLAAVPNTSYAGIITTVAGNGASGYSGDGGTATAAQLNMPYGVYADAFGNLFIADRDNHRIRKVDTSGNISTVAGNGAAGYSGDGGAATAAQLNMPSGVYADASGNLFIAERLNHRIRKVDTSGNISTVAGNGTWGDSGDGGAATAAQLNRPVGVYADVSGNLFIADMSNNRIRKVDTSGDISTVAGSGTAGYSGDGGAATAAQLNYPSGVYADAFGNLFIADANNYRIRKVDTSGDISTVAGNGTAGYLGDGGAATTKALNVPRGVYADASGNLFIADTFNNRIRKVDTSGNISTVAGNGSKGYSGDGSAATSAQLYYPYGVYADASGNLFIADSNNNCIRKMIPDDTEPDTSITDQPLNPESNAMPVFQFTGSDPGGSGVASYECRTDTDGWSACTSPHTIASLSDGFHTFQVRATDNAGNTDATPASYTWTIDTTEPDTNITDQPSNPESNATPAFQFTGSDSGGSGVASYECQTDTAGWAVCTSPHTVASLNDGSHTFQVRATDNAGNTDATPASYTWTVDTTVTTTTVVTTTTAPTATVTTTTVPTATVTTTTVPTATVTTTTVPTAASVMYVTSTAAAGSYTIGSVIELIVRFSKIVWVSGTPQLVLNIGESPVMAYYGSGGGTDTLTFQYTVAAGDMVSNLEYWSEWALQLNGGRIWDIMGNDVIRDLPEPGAPGSLSGDIALSLDTDYPVYRLYCHVTKKHLFTMDENEKDTLLALADADGAAVWRDEHIAYYAFHPLQYKAASRLQRNTLQAVHRFYSETLQTHLFTVDENEKETLIAEAADVWRYEGPAFYVPASEQDGAMPVHRFYNKIAKVHHFTVDENEKDHLETAGDVWRYEGVAYYAYP